MICTVGFTSLQPIWFYKFHPFSFWRLIPTQEAALAVLTKAVKLNGHTGHKALRESDPVALMPEWLFRGFGGKRWEQAVITSAGPRRISAESRQYYFPAKSWALIRISARWPIFPNRPCLTHCINMRAWMARYFVLSVIHVNPPHP